jgi:hypothetical protein
MRVVKLKPLNLLAFLSCQSTEAGRETAWRFLSAHTSPVRLIFLRCHGRSRDAGCRGESLASDAWS